MAYTPPTHDNVDFIVSDGYTAPGNNDVDFILGDTAITIIAPPFRSVTELTASPVIVLSIPAFESISEFVVSGVSVGFFIVIPAFISTSTMTAGVKNSLPLPAFQSTTELTAAIPIILQLDPFLSVSTMGAATLSTFQTGDAILRYYLTITGSADSTTDIEIPIVSFQARRRSGEETYLQVVLPSVDYIDQITARENGTIRIEQGYEKNDVVLMKETIIETTIDRADTYVGSENNSIVLTGYKQDTYSGKELTLTGSTYRALIDGKINVRLANPYIFLNPGDTVTIDDDTIEVGVMSYMVSSDFSQIEIQEA